MEYKFFKVKTQNKEIKMWEIGPNRDFQFYPNFDEKSSSENIQQVIVNNINFGDFIYENNNPEVEEPKEDKGKTKKFTVEELHKKFKE